MLFKNLFYSFSIVMIITSLISSFFLLSLPNPLIIQVDFNIFFSPLPVNLSMMVDKQSLVFLSTVSAVSSMVILYSFKYLEEGETPPSMYKFILILMVFVYSMFTLSFSSSLFWMMIGWDGLGISSFCLIIFYQNWKSFSSGMVTFLSNRMGDSLIIMSMISLMLNSSMNSWMSPPIPFIMSIMFLMGSYSKSAQFPFISWLPQAMAAPTPVSALVHSSTLVTAGIYSICRFSSFLLSESLPLLLLVSFTTVIIAGTSSLMEYDLKKVIALSTLCHISLMMIFSVLKDLTSSLIHLVAHAFFKSLLFMIAGYLIHTNMNSQDIRSIKTSVSDLKVSLPFFISIFSMMGIPFLSGFYSKENMMNSSSLNLPSISLLILFMMNSFFSCAYSSRITLNLFFSEKKIRISTPVNFKEEYSAIFIAGSLMSSFMSGILMFNMIPEDEENIHSSFMKLLLLFSCLTGIATGMSVDSSLSTQPSPTKKMMSDLWKSNYFYKSFQKGFFLVTFLTMWKIDEKGSMKMLFSNSQKKAKLFSSLLSSTFMKEPFFTIKISHIILSIFTLSLI